MCNRSGRKWPRRLAKSTSTRRSSTNTRQQAAREPDQSKTMTARKLFCLLIAAAATLCAHSASAEVMTWTIGGDTRSAIVYAPSQSPVGGKAPLILSFHGHGDNVQNFQHTD